MKARCFFLGFLTLFMSATPCYAASLKSKKPESSAYLFKKDAPLNERLEKLKPFFKPSFDQMITLKNDQILLHKDPYRYGKVTGRIFITPPKGQCLTIRRSEHSPDHKICQDSYLDFSAEELSPKGELYWTALTDAADDFGTPLRWLSAYRIGKLAPITARYLEESESVIILGCKVQKERRVKVNILGFEKPWSISFPTNDYPIKQPKPIPNLYYQIPIAKGGVLQAEKGKLMKGDLEGEEDQESKDDGIKRPQVSASEMRGNIDNEQARAKNVFEKLKEEQSGEDAHKSAQYPWQMSPRSAYTMNGSHISSQDAPPPGMLGRCRYRFSQKELEPAIECHGADSYRWLYLPLTCLDHLK